MILMGRHTLVTGSGSGGQVGDQFTRCAQKSKQQERNGSCEGHAGGSTKPGMKHV